MNSSSPPDSQNQMAPSWPNWDGTSLPSPGCCHQNKEVPLPSALSFYPSSPSSVLEILETRSLPVSLVEPAFPLLLIRVLAEVWIIQKASVMCLTSHNYATWGWWDVLSLTHSEFRGDSLIRLHFSHGTHQRNGLSPPNSSLCVLMQEGPFPLLL